MFQVAGCDVADLERWGASHSSHEVALEGKPQEAHRLVNTPALKLSCQDPLTGCMYMRPPNTIH